MTAFVVRTGIFFGLILMLSPCQGNISPPRFGSITYVNEGSDVKIPWTYNFGASRIFEILWFFTNDTLVNKRVAILDVTSDTVTVNSSILPGVNVTRPATLVLKNVNRYYNGTYRIEMLVSLIAPNRFSNVMVVVKVRPTAVANCSNVAVDEGDEIRCLCEGGHGNPPASVSWIKDGVTVAGPKTSQVLLVKTVGRNDRGTYICKAVSYDLQDETPAFLNVSYSPGQPTIVISPTRVVVGMKVIIRCVVDAYPPATVRILHSGTTVSKVETYVIPIASLNDSGTYQCSAKNRLGNSSTSVTLSVAETGMSSPTPSNTGETTSTENTAAVSTGGGGSGSSVGAIVGGVIGGLVVLVVVIVLVWWCKFRDGKDGPGRHHDVNPGGYEEPDRGENQYATADEAKPTNGEPSGTLPSTSENRQLPPVYAAVDKSKKTKKPAAPTVQYASLDPVDLQPDSSKMRDRGPPQETSYAAIDFGPLKADLV